ncbi:hypothetical protein T265_03604 [Opisthorchis viverrini]|uniref:AGC-kinase C-terminal domain-containing protein n=1 Tax=Opisthorchis viverrini TaxID=6198 RepID=A0A075A2M6_OPIVI|nr:hypothetical protein T265_03604 [Opisthorchis viverrini]KER29805.1 hypothetical protein T265_03604 [Opisthorchis viverrini]
MPFEEFERVMGACSKVFATWDDESDRLQGLLRDIIKKKREEQLRIGWRGAPAHRRLQIRLDHMRKQVYAPLLFRLFIVLSAIPSICKRLFPCLFIEPLVSGFCVCSNSWNIPVAPCLPPEGSTRVVILIGCSSLDTRIQDAEVGFEPPTFQSVSMRSNHWTGVSLRQRESCCNQTVFRHQHEQLRQVIMRVLRPAQTRVTHTDAGKDELAGNQPGENASAETTKGPDKVSRKVQPLLDASDANAIEEVNLAYEIVKEIDCLDVTKEGTDAWEAAVKRQVFSFASYLTHFHWFVSFVESTMIIVILPICLYLHHRYDERIDRVETRIAARLRDLLGTAKNANEMFRYFSRFNALFVRPHIRGAIREYQTQLIQRVKDDIEALHTKFKAQYSSSEAYHMTKCRDLPPVAGSIIWARQIERQLNAYLHRVEDVLGKGWEHHRDGQLLKTEGESFKAKLNTTEVFEAWVRKVSQKQVLVSGRIFNIEPIRARIATKEGETQTVTVLKLRVNFQPEVNTLAKEHRIGNRKSYWTVTPFRCLVAMPSGRGTRAGILPGCPSLIITVSCKNHVRNMKWLGFRVPLGIVNQAHQTNQLYPFAVSLIESVRTYESTCIKIEEHQRQNIGLLCAGLRRDAQLFILEGMNLIWESYRLGVYVQKFSENMLQFQEKVDDLLQTTREIDLQVKSLETCVYSKAVFEEIIGKIQKAVDELNLHQYSNLPQWVSRLDEEVERRLVVRLEAGVREWTRALRGEKSEAEPPFIGTSAAKHRWGHRGPHPGRRTTPTTPKLFMISFLFSANSCVVQLAVCALLKEALRATLISVDGVLACVAHDRAITVADAGCFPRWEYLSHNQIPLWTFPAFFASSISSAFRVHQASRSAMVLQFHLASDDASGGVVIAAKRDLSPGLQHRRVPIKENDDDAQDTHSSQQSKNPLGGEPKLKMIVHELRITNQQMHLHPSIEVAQQELLLSLGSWEGIVLNLPRIQHSRYQPPFIGTSAAKHRWGHRGPHPGRRTTPTTPKLFMISFLFSANSCVVQLAVCALLKEALRATLISVDGVLACVAHDRAITVADAGCFPRWEYLSHNQIPLWTFPAFFASSISSAFRVHQASRSAMVLQFHLASDDASGGVVIAAKRDLSPGLQHRRVPIKENDDDAQDTHSSQQSKNPLGGEPKLKMIVHELRITNQQMHLHPSIEVAQQELLLSLGSWEGIVLNLPRIQHSRYQVGLEVGSDVHKNYKKILHNLDRADEALEQAHQAILDVVSEAREYVKTWTSYQALWDLQSDQVYGRIGTDTRVWMNVLDEIKSMRQHFDVAESQKEFGPIVIMFGKVQSKVSLKYDNWHKDILSKFGNHLGTEMQELYNEVSKARLDMEQQTVEAGSTSEAVNAITYAQTVKRKMKAWEKQVELYRTGQNILYRDRFQFPSGWLDSENILGEWSAFQEILRRKETAISSQVASLQMKVVAEDKVVENKTTELLLNWEKEKPVEGDIKPEEAVNLLTILEGKFIRLREERENIQRAKEALELTEFGVASPSEQRVQVAIEELQDLKNVWLELSRVWEQIETLKETPWQTVQPRKLRQQLDTMANQIKELPTRLRQYASYEHVKRTLQSYAKVNVLVVELKSEALKERHWKMLMKKLNVDWTMSELTLGHVWDIDLQKNDSVIREVLLIAQGEKALEEFLKQVTEEWKNYTLDLISYQNKCRLIRGWDDLFTRVKERINSLTAMKMSPYFKQFEEEALAWEDRLNRINALFDVWIDVQRRWVYLDGIFAGSADIKILLPQESQRFQSVSTEFLGLMKKVAKSPLVMDVLNISKVDRQLERLADLLSKIQRSLGEYLERQRSSFPRFYFVGDEDLLEIIGNSKNVPRLQKHFKKMFAGVHSIKLNEDSTEVLGLCSKEGEEVIFIKPVSIKDNPVINDWLTLLEREMRVSLATYLGKAIQDLQLLGVLYGPNSEKLRASGDLEKTGFLDWLDRFHAQLVVLAAQVIWSESVDAALAAMDGKPSKDPESPLHKCLASVENMLTVLADSVLYEQPPVRRRKLEHLIIEHVHQRDVIRTLIQNNANSSRSFDWLSQMRFYFDPKQTDPLHQVSIQMANTKFQYGFEYLGVIDRLVQTPLTDRCYLTLTQALEGRLGGSPFGPAGTGKTESVKALGTQLGRFVLVFNCDETFDFHAMGRIFVGLCQVGAWGCFDEFNRLEERMLSAVSQQIQSIQETLRDMACGAKTAGKDGVTVELLGKQVTVHPDMAIFITMNPDYAGRSNLPDNLKKLFRSLAMTQPDRQLIAQVMLYSQGFRTAEVLASKIVPFFQLCDEQLSAQSHYDFGLRALKSVLVSSGNVKRERIRRIKDDILARGETVNESSIAEQLPEQEILIQSVMETMVPKLVAEDIPLLYSLLTDVFPGVVYSPSAMEGLRRELRRVCNETYLVYNESGLFNDATGHESNSNISGTTAGSLWVQKVLQLYQITCIHHGLMMVGPSGSGKSMAWRTLLKALERLEGVEGVAHVIDPKSINKESLYGYLDPNTREWTDGLFTHILRKIIDSIRGESLKRQWIIFDGDVDPEWVENLNSVLDDNRLLTLPNGERLGIPPNVRIMFEVQDLRYATLATVSRCGMVWFSEDVIPPELAMEHFIRQLQNVPIDEGEEETVGFGLPVVAPESSDQVQSPDFQDVPGASRETGPVSPTLRLQCDVASILQPHFADGGLVSRCLAYAKDLDHIMDFMPLRALTSLFSIMKQCIRNIMAYNMMHSDFPMSADQIESYVSKSLINAIIWSMCGDGRLSTREELGNYLREITTIPLPPTGAPIIDYEVNLNGEWQAWSQKVPVIEVETHKITSMDVVVPTMDTVRHEALLYLWLAEHRPMILCGPPGSGKTMTLFSALRSLPDMEVVGLNFSSATTPELMMKTFDQYCECRKTPNGLVLAPVQLNKWLVFFCDEINLPNEDKYGTQRVISFLRQMVEHGGFYRTSDMQWVKFERIQFVGACNPPTDPGRKPLSHRFLRHVPVIYVDYPGELSLKQIYGTFNRAMLRLLPSLRSQADALTNAMVDFFLLSQKRFTQDMQPHYIYSPRELSRWVRGIHEALKPLDSLSVEGLVRIWAHEALRLFQDRLIEETERQWTDAHIDDIALKYFPSIDKEAALSRPILFSNWLSKEYCSVEQETLRDYVKARLKVFYEEELDVPLVLFNQVLDHVLRIDRVFRQPQGHLLLIGISGAGKTTLSRFVSWINGLSVFQVKVHNKYTAEDFDDDLRNVLRRAGCKGEKITFIMDESNVLDSSFLERINTLLANGEVPGLFEGDEFAALMTQCKEGATRDGLMVDSHEELYKWFTNQICTNLHVVFTMNPSEDGLKDRASTSPALFNRCVLNWFGDWSIEAYFQVGREFTSKTDMERPDYKVPDFVPAVAEHLLPECPSFREMVANAFVFVHTTLHRANARLQKRTGRSMWVTPRHFLDFIAHFVKLMTEKRSDLEEQQLHLQIGLQKINETVEQVEVMQKSLTQKRQELEQMNEAANAKLKQMVHDQQEAEKRKTMSQRLQEELASQEVFINEKRTLVMNELSQVEPAVNDAKQAVNSVKRAQLVEVRSLGAPPPPVRLAIEAVCTMLGETSMDWKDLRTCLVRDNFIPSIVNFNVDDITCFGDP